MLQTCSQCRRANPPGAVYCYFDGFVLTGRAGGPLLAGSQLFCTPFVLPSGRNCRNFDEFALGCHDEWDAARELLFQGTIERFLGGIGRADLALCARQAARFPDADRGLNQLLTALPGKALEPPRLHVEPREICLGKLGVGENRRIELHLQNRAMGLVHGSVASTDGVWLAPGDPPGGAERHFQFRDEMSLAVRVCGDRLRAGTEPLAARLLIESNGGNAVVVVRAEVRITPFPDGPFANCKTPRQVAERARANPKVVAGCFESGAVARWYQSNGWVYPVQGPVATGLGAVQQFFEALGLTAAPKVELGAPDVNLAGEPGQALRETVEVRSREKRPVYAHATSNVPWLRPGRPRLNGQSASIPLEVAAVPDRPGETLDGQLTVHANGHQRFVVPVKLRITGSAFDFGAEDAVSPKSGARVVAPEPPCLPPFGDMSGEQIEDESPAAKSIEAFAVSPSRLAGIATGRSPRRRSTARGRSRQGKWIHAIPALALVCVLGALLLRDALHKPVAAPSAEPRKRIGYSFGELADADPRLVFNRGKHHDLRFGLVMTRERDPKNAAKPKRLTYEEYGASNNTCVKIDGLEHLLGRKPGRLVAEHSEADRLTWVAVWAYDDTHIQVTQTIQIVPGAQTGLLDTCLIRYTVENTGTDPHNVGLRVLFDTFIGAEDGVPFVLAGRKGLLTKPTILTGNDVPAHLEALERADPANPGTVAYMGIKNLQLPDIKAEPVVKMVIGTWPGSEKKWEWEEDSSTIKEDIKDSAVTLYWASRATAPGEIREMVFSYGLNAISSPEAGGTLALSTGGSYQVGKEFTVTAYVKKPAGGQKLRLEIPKDAVELADGEQAEQQIGEGAEFAQLSWRLRAKLEGTHSLAVSSGRAHSSFQVKITSRGLFH
jgi:hypothetical protein